MATVEERNQQILAQRKARYEAEFDSGQLPERIIPPDARLATAAEYAAFQLGQINQKLDRLIAAAERIAGSHPKL